MADVRGVETAADGVVNRVEFERLLQMVERQAEELRELRARLDGPDGGHPEPSPSSDGASPQMETPELVDRRSMLRRAGVAAGAVVGGVAGAALTASPAAAANGGNMILGQSNTATVTTTLVSNLAAPGLHVRSGNPTGNGTAALSATAAADGVTNAMWARAEKANGIALLAHADSIDGLAAHFDNAKGATIRLVPRGPAPIDRAGESYFTGDVLTDATGALWVCIVSGTPGVWREVAGPSTAGSLHVLPAPKRVFDSRAGQVPLNVAKGAFVNQTKAVDAKNNSSGVPADATAVLVNFAVTNTNSGGFGALWAFGVADPGTANINWGSANTTISNTVVTAVGTNAQFNCKIAGSADVIIDVIGYYR